MKTMARAIYALLALGGIVCLLPWSMLHASDWSWRAGLGYEFLSQQYSLDSLVELEGDSLAAMTALKTTYLDDLKGAFRVTYSPQANRTLELGAGLEQTKDISRFRLFGSGSPRPGITRLDWNAELDWRRAVDGDATAGESFVTGRAGGRVTRPVAVSLSLYGALDGDFVQFDSSDRYTRSYARAGVKAGIIKDFGELSTCRMGAFASVRNVPDSSDMNYRTFGGEIWLLGLFSRSTLDIYARLEARDYDQPDHKDDYTRLDMTVDHTLPLEEAVFARVRGELEAMFFDDADPYGYDYTRLKLRSLVGLRSMLMSVSAGPEIAYMAVRSGDYAPEEDYREYGLATDFDVISPGRLFCSLESTVGYRNLMYEDDLQSDYMYERLSLIGDLRLLSSLTLNALVSAEWEWHDQADENNQVFLISTNLSYTF